MWDDHYINVIHDYPQAPYQIIDKDTNRPSLVGLGMSENILTVLVRDQETMANLGPSSMFGSFSDSSLTFSGPKMGEKH